MKRHLICLSLVFPLLLPNYLGQGSKYAIRGAIGTDRIHRSSDKTFLTKEPRGQLSMGGIFIRDSSTYGLDLYYHGDSWGKEILVTRLGLGWLVNRFHVGIEGNYSWAADLNEYGLGTWGGWIYKVKWVGFGISAKVGAIFGTSATKGNMAAHWGIKIYIKDNLSLDLASGLNYCISRDFSEVTSVQGLVLTWSR